MRIAMFSDNFYPELSGISDSLADSARELSGLGHEVDFYVPRYAEADFKTGSVPFEEIDLGRFVKIHRLFSLPYPAPTKQGRMIIPMFLRSLAMRGANRPDVIHTHLFFGAGMEALAASRLLHIPLVGTSHTPITEFIRYSPVRSAFAEKIASDLVSWYYNRCDFVTAPSQGILDEMKRSGFDRPNRVLSNPVDLKQFFPATDEQRTALKQDFGLSDFTVLYTGRLAVEKHIDIIIRAIARAKEHIPSVSLAITGHGDAEPSLRKLAETLGVATNVKFFGTLPVEDHARIYRAADVFAIASTAETQSISLMKAMATGIPAIGVNARALPEYITERTGFIVEPGDFEAMAEKIIFLSDRPEERFRLGAGGIDLTRHFSPAAIAASWNRIYEETVEVFQKKNG
jgi:glycosyltransferase involved in cell wall biosynthesis